MKRLPMRKIREVLRLKFEHQLSIRKIASSCNVSRATVSDYLNRFAASGLEWPLSSNLDETTLDQQLFPVQPPASKRQLALPAWSEIHQELRKPGVTLMVLWQEYKTNHPDGYQYSWFSDRYREWRTHLDVVMRQNHIAGDKLFIDYAGQTVSVVNQNTGEVQQAQVFIATLGASSYTYAEATLSQSLPDWIGSHVRTFEYLGGVPNNLVPDNLKSGVKHPHRYEPEINPTYQDLAEHYNVAVVPARVRSPKDKGKVESAVQIVERWILARLRHQTFFSLASLNEAIARSLTGLNNEPFQKLTGSRRSLFDSLDKPALRPLPETRYQYAEWKEARVHIDYHVEVDKHYYSVPYQLVKKQLSVRMTSQTIECFHKGQRVASHRRSQHKGRHTTQASHMPEKHRKYAEWTPERMQSWARQIGPETAAVIQRVLATRRYPEQSYRSCQGIIRLAKGYGNDRLENACRRALYADTCTYRSIESILKHNLDQQPLPELEPETVLPDEHENLRGSGYFN
ncbi:IS21 family transposase [Endozoicomonas euniceicola]|uniref:IS21 family transposase n=1 Tax=Endozoicomonas euniceicola TaxID=1234143 RepID=A0ABY6GTC6_9GAMM|nr:IS21 family transposase [Endozoicomonas euniceicola]UYM15945.1 IS21 family transposase [Endozoicomonas euniceicola]